MRRLLMTSMLLLIIQISYAQSNNNILEETCYEEICVEQKILLENESKVIDDVDDQQCFDHSMDVWFLSFFLLQEEGYDMRQADHIAYQEAKFQYGNCNTTISRIKVIDIPLQPQQL